MLDEHDASIEELYVICSCNMVLEAINYTHAMKLCAILSLPMYIIKEGIAFPHQDSPWLVEGNVPAALLMGKEQ